MSAGKHTEGPWYVLGEDELAGIEFVEIASGDLGTSSYRSIGWIGCGPDGISDEDRANANLAAAATEMLEALRYALTRCVSEAAYPHACIEDRKMRDLVAAAIARAEGRADG